MNLPNKLTMGRILNVVVRDDGELQDRVRLRLDGRVHKLLHGTRRAQVVVLDPETTTDRKSVV